MILFCPECHRTFVFDDAEVKAKGGPGAFHCDECNGRLTTMEAGLGLTGSLGGSGGGHRHEHTQPDAVPLMDEGTEEQPTHIRPAFNPGASNQRDVPLTRTAAYQDADPTAVDRVAAPDDNANRPRVRLTGEQEIPAEFLQGGPGGAMRGGHPQGGPRTGAMPPVQLTTAVPIMQMTGSYGAIPQGYPTMNGGPGMMGGNPNMGGNPGMGGPEPAPGGGRRMGVILGVGCVVVLLLGLLIGGIAAAAIFFTKDKAEGPDGGGDGPKVVQGKETPKATRPPMEDRVLEAASALPGTAVPAVQLPGRPQEGEVILVGPAVWYNGKSVANVNLGRVAADARSHPDSPYIVALGESLEKTFASVEDPNDDAPERWVLVLADGKVTYRALYEVMYTAWNRGSHIQLAATNPMNPNAYLAVEVVPTDWPDSSLAHIPEMLPERQPASPNTEGLKGLVITVNDKGFLLRREGEPTAKAVPIEKVSNAWPVSSLKQEILQRRKDDSELKGIRIIPAHDITTFTLLQTIGACVATGEGVEPPTLLRVAAPTDKK